MNNLNAEDILDDYKVSLQKIGLWENQLRQLEDTTPVKTTSYTDDASGIRTDIYDKYQVMIENKDVLRFDILYEKMKIANVNKALELLYVTHPMECNSIKLRYLMNKSIKYIQEELGYSERQTNRNISTGKYEFLKIISLIK